MYIYTRAHTYARHERCRCIWPAVSPHGSPTIWTFPSASKAGAERRLAEMEVVLQTSSDLGSIPFSGWARHDMYTDVKNNYTHLMIYIYIYIYDK